MTNRLYAIIDPDGVRFEGSGDYVGLHIEVIDTTSEDTAKLVRVRQDDGTFYYAGHRTAIVWATDIKTVEGPK